MIYKCFYKSPQQFSDIWLLSDGINLTGLYFDCHKNLIINKNDGEEIKLPIFEETSFWLDCYFSGRAPNFIPKIKIENLSPFGKDIIDILTCIKFGQVVTYGVIADQLAKNKGLKKMSAQAVGAAIGRNPISIIIPCHRVIGSRGAIVGYSGGINNKYSLLKLEGINIKLKKKEYLCLSKLNQNNDII